MHPVWKNECRNSNAVIKPDDSDGKYHCLADPPYEGKCYSTRNALSRHYLLHHSEWWNEHKEDKKPRI
jgi:hypothetical protein